MVVHGAIDAVDGVFDLHVFDQHVWNLRPQGIMHLPDFQIAEFVRVLRIRADAVAFGAVVAGEDHAVQTFSVGFVIFETINGDAADVDRFDLSCWREHVDLGVEAA